MSKIRTCSVTGCQNPHWGLGYCRSHHQRFKLHGDPLKGRLPPSAVPETCKVDGCNNKGACRGYCDNHYYRFRVYGDPLGGHRFKNQAQCAIDGCDRPAKSKQLCLRHYRRLWRHGDPLGGRPTFSGDPMRWLNDHVNHSGDDCLDWPYWKNSAGYGHVQYEGANHAAAHVMCILKHGNPPTDKHEVAHSCGRGNRGCVNPNHLRWDTRKGNMADKVIHGTSPQGERHPQSVLTDDAVRFIRQNTKLSQREMAEMFDVTISCISSVFVGRTWRHLL